MLYYKISRLPHAEVCREHLCAFVCFCGCNEFSTLYIRRKQAGNCADWLMALPQSTLVDVMQRRCRLMCGIIRCGPSAQRDTFTRLTDADVIQQEARISET